MSGVTSCPSNHKKLVGANDGIKTNSPIGRVWWLMPLISLFRRQRQCDLGPALSPVASQEYIVRFYLKKIKKKNK